MSKSIYIHIPFCSRRCDYCDFATWVDKSGQVQSYIDAVITQWKYHLESGEVSKDEKIKSIFFGGGTPNYIDAQYIAKVLETISDSCDITQAEITLESNPDHVKHESMHIYKSAGINRISLGVQSTHDHVLQYLGREHKKENVYRAIEIITDVGIDNFSCDLIYGSPVESLDEWLQTLEDIIALSPKHISAYALGIESGTPLSNEVKLGIKQTTNEDDLADKYELCDQLLTEKSFGWYEISNWAKKGYESKHNLTYWHGGDVIALGCAAHGVIGNRRWSTPRNIDVYLEKISLLHNNPAQFFIDQSAKTADQQKQEKFALQLRTNSGYIWPHSFETSETLKQYIEINMLNFDQTSNKITLTTKGKLMAHRLTIDLYEELVGANNVVE